MDFSVISVETLVLFKIKAWLDLSNRKLQGENIDSSDIKKHKNDIFRLSTLILGTETLLLPEEVKSDVVDFCKKMKTEFVQKDNQQRKRIPICIRMCILYQEAANREFQGNTEILRHQPIFSFFHGIPH